MHSLAKAKGVKAYELTRLVLDRPRHADLIAAIRRTGAGVRLITDGDVAGVIFTTKPQETGIDIYLGIGAAPEGVLAAGALRCIGGQMQGRLILDTEEKRTRAAGMGVTDPNRKYDMTRSRPRRRDRGGDGRHGRRAPQGRQVRPGGDRDRDHGLPIRDRHRARIYGEHRELSKFHLDLSGRIGPSHGRPPRTSAPPHPSS